MRSRQQTEEPSKLEVKFLVEDDLRPESVVGQTQPGKQENKLNYIILPLGVSTVEIKYF